MGLTEIARTFAGECIYCGSWAEMLASGRRCPACFRKRFDLLEELAEVAGMYLERLPGEVREALEKANGGAIRKESGQ